MANILVTGSDEVLRDIMAVDLRKSGHEVVGAASIHKAIELIKENAYDVLVADLNCPQPGGVNLLKVLDKAMINTEVILMTDQEAIEKAVEAMKLGVWDYIVKPPSLQKLSLIIDRALEKKQLTANLKHLQKKIMEKYTFGNIVAGSMRMRHELELAREASISDNPVLITGESGTGKRLIGNTIHTNSPRGREPLIFVDLSSVDQKTMESVLFGSVRDLAAGHERSTRGAIECADRGSIFLYEITNAVPGVQDKLMEFLECSMVSRTGSNEMIYVDARVIVASSMDIEGFLERGEFRKDLYRGISQAGYTSRL